MEAGKAIDLKAEVLDLQADVLVRIEKAGLDNPKLRNIVRVLSELVDILSRGKDSATEYDAEDLEMNMFILHRDVLSFTADLRTYQMDRRYVDGKLNPKFHPFYIVFKRDIKQLIEAITAGFDEVREGTAEAKDRAAHDFKAALIHLRGNTKEA